MTKRYCYITELADSQKREVMLRDALEYHQAQTRPIERTGEALAATADLKDVILCHWVAIGYRYELKAGEYTFSENRYSDERYVSRMTPLYSAWEPKK